MPIGTLSENGATTPWI